jgi:hypothetical protein
MSKSLIEKLEPELKNMMGAGRIDPEVYVQLTSIINEKTNEWSEELSEEIKQKAKDWEEVMGPEKEGFYSLAMRRCADYITGKGALDDR